MPIASASSRSTRPDGIGRRGGARHHRVDVAVPPHVERARGAGPDRDADDRGEGDHRMHRHRRADEADEGGEDDEPHDPRLQELDVVAELRLAGGGWLASSSRRAQFRGASVGRAGSRRSAGGAGRRRRRGGVGAGARRAGASAAGRRRRPAGVGAPGRRRPGSPAAPERRSARELGGGRSAAAPRRRRGAAAAAGSPRPAPRGGCRRTRRSPSRARCRRLPGSPP